MSILTQQEYRRLSGDTVTPWTSEGFTLGAEDWVAQAVERMSNYLSTYLEPTLVSEERHRAFPDSTYVYPWGVGGTWREVWLNKYRMLTGVLYPITVTLTHHNFCACTETTVVTCASILDAKRSVVNITPCVTASSSGQCCWWSSSVPHYAEFDYWAGFVSVPEQLKWCVADLAREMIRGLPGCGDLRTEKPTGAPLTSMSHLGVSRSWAAPHTDTPFGRTHFGLTMVNRLSVYKVKRVIAL